MGVREEFLIRHFFKMHVYGKDKNNLFEMFKEFAEENIQTPNDIAPVVTHFRHIIESSADYLSFDRPESKIKFGDDRYKLFSQLSGFSSKLTAQQQEYIYIVNKLISNPQSAHLLDVGAGMVAPMSSILFAQKVGRVSSMDKHMLSTETLRKLGVEGIYGYFDSKTSVDQYDMVAGRMPCQAIDSIVEVCSKANTPYFIRTCDCELRDPDNKNWHQILPEIDPNIKFYKDYAFNADASVPQVKQICNDFYSEFEDSQPFIAPLPYVKANQTLQNTSPNFDSPVQE